ncbi:hypothetical protein D915_009680 [Fasciola hepatica]|uniref:Uncharacterized protein n=1 Tax=Fasciola hepatica TaxID=6192 RepID=A0A4E0R0V0_FASHE|nr:hypothetical protein D915_009680 [Fasciola hepatica]
MAVQSLTFLGSGGCITGVHTIEGVVDARLAVAITCPAQTELKRTELKCSNTLNAVFLLVNALKKPQHFEMKLRLRRKSRSEKDHVSQECLSDQTTEKPFQELRRSSTPDTSLKTHEESPPKSPGSVEKNEKVEGPKELLARRFSPFRLHRRFSESREQCCAHQKEIDDLRLLVMKLNRRLYFAETDPHLESNDQFVEPTTLPGWVKDPTETCMLLERTERQLGEQAVLLNEYEHMVTVLRDKLETTTNEKKRLASELTKIRFRQEREDDAVNDSQKCIRRSSIDLSTLSMERILNENQQLADFIQNKQKRDEKMYHLVEDQLHQIMQQVNQITKNGSTSKWHSQCTLREQSSTPIYYRGPRRKYSLGQRVSIDREATNVMNEGTVTDVANKLE